MTSASVREARHLALEDKNILYLNSFPNEKLVLTVSVSSRKQSSDVLSVSVWDQHLTKLIKRTYLEFETSEKESDIKVESDGKFVVFYNLSKGFINLYEFPKFNKPILSLNSLENLKAVVLYSQQHRLFTALRDKEIDCYKYYGEEVEYTISLQSKQNLETIYLIQEQKWLIATTVNEVYTIDVNQRSPLNNFETHKLPAIGKSDYDLEHVLGYISKPNKIILKAKEVSANSSGLQEKEDIIEICNMNDLRKDMRFSLGTDIGFYFINEQDSEVIWSIKNSLYLLDLKSKEVAHLYTLNRNQTFITGKVLGKSCGRGANTLVVATADRLKLLSYSVDE